MAAHQADLPQLAGYDGRMGGAPADGRQDAGGHGEAGDVLGRGVVPDKDDRLAAGGERLGAAAIEGDAPRRHARRCRDRRGDGRRLIGEAGEMDAVEVFVIDDDGRIAELRAYWDMSRARTRA